MLSFFVDNGERSTQITNKKQSGSEKKEDVTLNLKRFIKEEIKIKISFHMQVTLPAYHPEVRILKIKIYYIIFNRTTNKTDLHPFF